jgi:hypothetical protein
VETTSRKGPAVTLPRDPKGHEQVETVGEVGIQSQLVAHPKV